MTTLLEVTLSSSSSSSVDHTVWLMVAPMSDHTRVQLTAWQHGLAPGTQHEHWKNWNQKGMITNSKPNRVSEGENQHITSSNTHANMVQNLLQSWTNLGILWLGNLHKCLGCRVHYIKQLHDCCTIIRYWCLACYCTTHMNQWPSM